MRKSVRGPVQLSPPECRNWDVSPCQLFTGQSARSQKVLHYCTRFPGCFFGLWQANWDIRLRQQDR
ncbi:hypothetical protein B0G81_2208 [Paraburkholderia sp. BL6665CI2N2]|nr:hypothetical protein B0G81_2208 [Paraburkholderia sp. BL6665CI2N2]